MKRVLVAGIAIIVAAVGIGLASPLFYDTEVNEALPAALDEMQEGLTLEKFSSMDEEPRAVLADSMSPELREMIMDASAAAPTSVSEEMEGAEPQVLGMGQFEGLAGHSASGVAKVLEVSGQTYLRFEDFGVTNGPDLRVYLTPGGDVGEGIHIDKLKGSRGAQNYLIDADTSVYDTVVIYCQPFGVYFGQATLA